LGLILLTEQYSIGEAFCLISFTIYKGIFWKFSSRIISDIVLVGLLFILEFIISITSAFSFSLEQSIRFYSISSWSGFI